MIDALIFDAEGVVIDTEPMWDRGQLEFLRRYGHPYDRSRVKPLLAGQSAVNGARILKELFGLPGDPADLALERIELVRQLFHTEVRFIHGFEEFYHRVQPVFKTCLATALDEGLLRAADQTLGLSRLFGDRVVTLSDVGFRSKPEPDLFLHAADLVSSPPERCLVIEDSPNGIEAANRARMQCIGLATTFEPAQLTGAGWVARNYDEVNRILELAAPAR